MNNKDIWFKHVSKSAILSPVDRISEVLFGLIMVLTFTGTISVSSDGRDEIRDLLWAALGCNVAWGLVDAVMYLMNVLFERGYQKNVLKNIRNAGADDKVKILKDEMPPLIADLMDDADAKKMAEKISALPEPPFGVLLTGKDFLSGLQIFFLVFLCTLPVALPFGLVNEAKLALRCSNGIALLMLFLGGYQLARFSGFKPFTSGFIYMLIGLVLVALTIALGG